MTSTKQSTRQEKRRKTRQDSKPSPSPSPSPSPKTRRQKNRAFSRHSARDVQTGGLNLKSPATGVQTPTPVGNAEERREMHRMHERLRHQSLNGAIKELVKILPNSDSHKSVTKYNVLQRANDYIDFLQHKINRLCLEKGIEHNTQDGRLSFSIPLNTVVGGEEFKIPASTLLSPKTLHDLHKSTRNVPQDPVLPGPFSLQRNKATPPARFCRYRLKKKSPRLKTVVWENKHSGVNVKKRDVSHTAAASKPQNCLAENSPDELPSDSSHVNLVVDKKVPSQLDDCIISWEASGIPEQPAPQFIGRNIFPKRSGSQSKSLSASDDQELKKSHEDFIVVDSLPESSCAISPKQVEVLPPASIPVSSSSRLALTTIQPLDTNPHLYNEHSYSTRVLAAFISSGVPTEASLPSDAFAPYSGQQESSHVSLPEMTGTQVIMPSEAGVICQTDTQSILSPTLYICQQPSSLPVTVVTHGSAIISKTPVIASSVAPARQTRTTASTPSCKSTSRFVPIQPATNAPTNEVASSSVMLPYNGPSPEKSSLPQKNQATVASAQKLVADPSCLHFEESGTPPDITCSESSASIMTETTSSGCPMRRSWINGYQLFTKVNHPRFREKWPRLQGREITRLLSQAWKELPSHFKKHYSRRAREWNQWHRSKREMMTQASQDV